jgi:hypothetical protein
MSYTLGTAAKAVGKSKAAISKAIKTGRIVATRLDNGSYRIEPVELHKIFPAIQPEDTRKETSDILLETEFSSNETILLQVKLDAALKRIGDLEDDRDQWRQQAKRLLSKQEQEQRKGLWNKIFGG